MSVQTVRSRLLIFNFTVMLVIFMHTVMFLITEAFNKGERVSKVV